MKRVSEELGDWPDLRARFRAAGVYAALGTLWILFSDRVLAALVKEPGAREALQMFGGWLFAGITALVLYVLLRPWLPALRGPGAALRESESRFRSLIDTSAGVVICVSPELRITEWNREAETVLGWTRDEVLGKCGLKLLFPEARREEAAADAREALAGEPIWQDENAVLASDGTERVMLWNVTSLPGHGGVASGLMIVGQAVTDQARAEEAQRHNEERLRAILDTAAEGIITIDENGEIASFNRSAHRIFGYPPEEALGKNISMLMPEPHFSQHHGYLANYLEMGEARIIGIGREVEGLRKNGEIFPMHLSVSEVSLGDRKMFAGIVHDITDQKEAQESLRETNRRLAETLEELKRTQEQIIQTERLRALGEMASGVAHDINNSLSAITMFSSLGLRQDGLEAKVRTCFENVNKAAHDATNTVTRMREFYRPRNPHEEFEPVDINRAVTDAISLTQAKWRNEAQARGVDIEIHTELGAAQQVMGNVSDLREVITNFIFNAVDAMPQGGQISIRTQDDGSEVLIRVADTGTGMDEATSQRIFEPFFTTKGPRGTGLGLSVCWGIMQRHSGKLSVESEVGGGTVFEVRIAAATRGEQGEELPAAPLPGVRILAVDDEPLLRDGLQQLLSDMGHTVVVASSGEEALATLSRHRFDAVITDLGMPSLSGLKVAQEIKRRSPRTPVILFTGWGRSEPTELNDVDFVVNKPATPEALDNALRAVLKMDGPRQPE